MSSISVRNSLPSAAASPGDRTEVPSESNENASQAAPASHRGRKIATWTAVSAVALAGAGRVAEHAVVSNFEASWGTLESPRFTISETATLHPISTYRERATELIESARTWKKELLALDAKVGDLSSISDLETRRGLARTLYEKNFGPYETVAAISNSEEEVPGGALAKSETTKDPILQRPQQEVARELVETLVGQKLPEVLSFEVGDVPIEGIGGFANSLTSTATAEACNIFPSEEANYYETVGVLGHEVGHLVFGFSESKLDSWTPWNAATYGTRVREEAAAVAFRTLVGAQPDDPQTRFFVSGDTSRLIEEFMDGKLDYGLAEGAALADAAFTLHSDPRAAYKAITTPGELDPALRTVIAANRELCLQQRAILAENQQLHERIQKRLKSLIEPQ
ncbi:MAG: hypothetical protein J0M12_15045 [Deltaproteobacteria bacterium]|nr:hypothetical protein [Deltaproteobacteria bacterium]